jgi:SAM-dependent methyltransferase
MGIRLEFLDIIDDAAAAADRRGDAWVMGAADCSFSPAQANAWLAEHDRDARLPADWQTDPEPVFRALGFERYTDVDINDLARRKIDLTQPLDEDCIEAADLVVDAGTLEHIFDLPAALYNMNRILRPGGVILHITPVNFFEHGFVNVNPSLYTGFYGANGYTPVFLTFQVTIHNPLRIPRISPWMPAKLARFNLPYRKRPQPDWVRTLMRLSAVTRLPRNLLVLAAFRKEKSIDRFKTPMDVWDE